MKASFQQLGHVPIVSTFSGLARVARGIGRIFSKNLDKKIQDSANKTHGIYMNYMNYAQNTKFKKTKNEYSHEKNYTEKYAHIENGFRDVVRGLVEAIPIIGNLAVIIFDRKRDNS